MNKIFHNADDKYLKTVVLHGHTDNFLYHDEKHTKKVTKAEFMTVMYDDIIVVKQGINYRPVSIKVAGAQGEVVIVTNTDATAAAATLKTAN